jgi:putative intracellular protease/amidase
MAAKKILIVITSNDTLLNTDSKTGVWLGEFTHPYYVWKDKGYQLTLASPNGGEPPVDSISRLTEHITPHNRRFDDDQDAQNQFKNTLKLSSVRAEDFDALFFPGGHGPVFDLAASEVNGRLILDFVHAGKPVCAVCHGPAALVKAGELEPGLFRGKKMTGFSNAEEGIVMKKNNVPWLLEDKLKEMGAEYHSSTIPFTGHVECDGIWITGQNPMSAGPMAEALVDKFEGRCK